MKFIILAHGSTGTPRYVGVAHSKEEAERWGAKFLVAHPDLDHVTLTNASISNPGPVRTMTPRGAKTLLTRRGLARPEQS